MEIAGLPLHPLVVHLVVVLVPVAALVSVVFAVVPRWRWLLRWPAALLALGAVAASWVARLSGASLLDDRPFLLDAEPLRTRVSDHQQLGEILSWSVLPFAAVVVLAAWALPGRSPLVDGRAARESRLPAAERILTVAVIVVAAAILVVAVLTGDSGSRAVWG
jgi:hypothetical protein